MNFGNVLLNSVIVQFEQFLLVSIAQMFDEFQFRAKKIIIEILFYRIVFSNCCWIKKMSWKSYFFHLLCSKVLNMQVVVCL